MANIAKKVIDRQMWVQMAPSPNAHAAGMGFASDLRNDISRNPFIYQLASATVLNRLNIITKSWQPILNPGLGGTFGAGAGAVFAPSRGLIGAVGVGSTTSSVVTSTVITAVGRNMLANRGGSGDFGFKIRIQGSGKTEERWIIGNTSGTTPVITLDAPLSFTPANGDTYEILGGRLFMLSAGALAATIFRSFEVATNTLASLSNTNLPATISTDFAAVALDELYVPYTRKPGEGFFGSSTYNGTALQCLTASAATANTITIGAGGDAGILANEYRNFQIRIVEDTATPTAVGQRSIIASHTAGATAAFTMGANWTVTPSSTAKFVVEYPNLILLWSTATAVTYTYNYNAHTVNNGTNSIAAGAWHATYFANRGGNMGAGCMAFASFGIIPDTARNARQSMIHTFRGAGAVTLDVLDIAGAINGSWESAAVYDGSPLFLPTTGSCGKYAPCDNEGRFGYLNFYVASVINQIYRYDVKNRVLSSFTPTDWQQAGAAAAGDRIATCVAIDGNDKYTVVLLLAHLSTITQEIIVQF